MKHQQLKRVPLVYWTLVDPIGEVARLLDKNMRAVKYSDELEFNEVIV